LKRTVLQVVVEVDCIICIYVNIYQLGEHRKNEKRDRLL